MDKDFYTKSSQCHSVRTGPGPISQKKINFFGATENTVFVVMVDRIKFNKMCHRVSQFHSYLLSDINWEIKIIGYLYHLDYLPRLIH